MRGSHLFDIHNSGAKCKTGLWIVMMNFHVASCLSVNTQHARVLNGCV